MNYLHKNKEIFEELINETSNYYKISPEIIRHDYYVSYILKSIAFLMPDVIFKGGTSLSKCYEIIDRYSEDIDLNRIQDVDMTNKDYKSFHHKLFNLIEELGFDIENMDDLKSGAKVNTIFAKLENNALSGKVKIETYLTLKSFPINKKMVHSYIEKYLIAIGRDDIVKQYELEPFLINTQNIERTFIDKIFAICDYYERKEDYRNSRHLYDLHQLFDKIIFDEKFYSLFTQVKDERKLGKIDIYVSSQDGYDLKNALSQIIQSNFYRLDYINTTSKLLYSQVSYEEAVSTLKKIINIMK